MSKRVWNIRCIRGASDETYKYPYCAICRVKLSEQCPTACALIDTEPFFVRAKRVWETLMMGRKRRESPLNTIDALAVDKIFRFFLADVYGPEETECQVYHLECGHVYHSHCFDTWVARHAWCPLDNKQCIIPTHVSSKRRKKLSGVIMYYEDGNFTRDKYDLLVAVVGTNNYPVSRQQISRAFPTYQPRSVDEALNTLVDDGIFCRRGNGYLFTINHSR